MSPWLDVWMGWMPPSLCQRYEYSPPLKVCTYSHIPPCLHISPDPARLSHRTEISWILRSTSAGAPRFDSFWNAPGCLRRYMCRSTAHRRAGKVIVIREFASKSLAATSALARVHVNSLTSRRTRNPRYGTYLLSRGVGPVVGSPCREGTAPAGPICGMVDACARGRGRDGATCGQQLAQVAAEHWWATGPAPGSVRPMVDGSVGLVESLPGSHS